jgi:RNA polymerase sigma factor (sigma-70 family)
MDRGIESGHAGKTSSVVTTTRRREAPALAEAFERLVRRHRSEIFRTVFRLSRNREDAEDLTQITFLNAYAALQRGAQPEAPRAWLHAIARNAGSRSFRQRRIVEVELDEETSSPVAEDVTSIAELQSALARLTLNQRAALLMREVGGLSAREIATRLGISPGAVATLLFRARRALRAELEGTPEWRPLLGGVGALTTALRSAWLRLLGPACDGSELLSRSATAVGVAAAAAGVAYFTTSAVPVPAHAGGARVVHVATHARTVAHVAAVPRMPVAHLSLPAKARGTAHVATFVAAPRRPHVSAPTSTPHVSSSSPNTAPSEPAPAEPSAPVHATAPAPAAPDATAAQAPAESPQPAPVAETAASAQAQAQELVTSATHTVTSAQAVTNAVPSTPATTLPETPAPVPVDVPAVTPPPVEPPALPAPPTGILPGG